jgi:hypothetical protein
LENSYCGKHYSEESEESRDVYLSLLEVYLYPPAESQAKPLLDQALNILNKYYKYALTQHARHTHHRALSQLLIGATDKSMGPRRWSNFRRMYP